MSQKMKHLHVEMRSDLFHHLQARALLDDMTVRKIVETAVAGYLEAMAKEDEAEREEMLADYPLVVREKLDRMRESSRNLNK